MYRWKTEIHVPVLTFISQTNSYSSNFWLHELINQFIDLNKIHACIYLFSLRFPVTVKELTDENGLNKNIDNHRQVWIMIILSINSKWLIRYVPLLRKTFSGWIRNSLLSPHRNQTLCQQFDKLSLSTCLNCNIV